MIYFIIKENYIESYHLVKTKVNKLMYTGLQSNFRADKASVEMLSLFCHFFYETSHIQSRERDTSGESVASFASRIQYYLFFTTSSRIFLGTTPDSAWDHVAEHLHIWINFPTLRPKDYLDQHGNE